MEEVQVHRWDNLVSHLMDQFKEACSPNIKAQVSQKEVLVRQLKLMQWVATNDQKLSEDIISCPM